MGVPSDGSYGVPPGVIFSYPVTTKNFTYSIVQGLPINEFSQGKLNATSQELFAEKSEALSAWFVYISEKYFQRINVVYYSHFSLIWGKILHFFRNLIDFKNEIEQFYSIVNFSSMVFECHIRSGFL